VAGPELRSAYANICTASSLKPYFGVAGILRDHIANAMQNFDFVRKKEN